MLTCAAEKPGAEHRYAAMSAAGTRSSAMFIRLASDAAGDQAPLFLEAPDAPASPMEKYMSPEFLANGFDIMVLPFPRSRGIKSSLFLKRGAALTPKSAMPQGRRTRRPCGGRSPR